jgi:hypothetical protein
VVQFRPIRGKRVFETQIICITRDCCYSATFAPFPSFSESMKANGEHPGITSQSFKNQL